MQQLSDPPPPPFAPPSPPRRPSASYREHPLRERALTESTHTHKVGEGLALCFGPSVMLYTSYREHPLRERALTESTHKVGEFVRQPATELDVLCGMLM